MRCKVLAAAIAAAAIIAMPLTACGKGTPDCASVTFAGTETVQGADKRTGERVVLYPVKVTLNGFGVPTNISEESGRSLGFPNITSNEIRMFLPAGNYAFSGPWEKGACNPNFSIRK